MKPNIITLVFVAPLLSDTTWLDGYDIWSCVRVDMNTSLPKINMYIHTHIYIQIYLFNYLRYSSFCLFRFKLTLLTWYNKLSTHGTLKNIKIRLYGILNKEFNVFYYVLKFQLSRQFTCKYNLFVLVLGAHN
jgi:hypothetical protein